MKILMVANIKLPPKTGEAVHFLELSRHFVKNNAKIFMIIPKPKIGKIRNLNEINLYFYKSYDFPIFGYFLSMLLMLITVFRISLINKFDMMYLRQSSFFFFINFIAKLLGIPIFLEVNGISFLESKNRNENLLLRGYYYLMDNSAIKGAKGVICVSSLLKKYVATIRKDETVVLGSSNGVDINKFNIKVNLGEIKRKYLIKNEVVLIFVGHLVQWFDLNVLLYAFKIVNSKYHNIKLIIVGGGPLENELKLNIKKMDLKNVIMTGKIQHNKIPNLLAISHIAILPLSDTPHNYFVETPLKLLEYFAAGKAVVASKVGNISNVIINNKYGRLFYPINEIELANAIIDLLDNPDKIKMLGENSRKLCENKYSWDIITKNIMVFIRRLLGN